MFVGPSVNRVVLMILGIIGCSAGIFFVVSYARSMSSRSRNNVLVGVLAGAVTGFCEAVLMFPLENIKIQQQLKRSTMLEIANVTLHAHGLRGFYRGIIPVLIGAVPSQGLRWGVITAFCGFMAATADGDAHNKHEGGGGCARVMDTFVAALVAGIVVALLIGVPMDTLKTEAVHGLYHRAQLPAGSPSAHRQRVDRLPMEGKAGGSLILVVASDVDEVQPVRPSRWRGLLPTVLKKTLNQVVRFPAHHVALLMLCGMVGGAGQTCHASDHLLLSFLAGAIAGCSSILVTQPLDVVKTRLQGLPSMQNVVYRHSLHCARHIVVEEGWAALFDGLAARALRSSLGAALTFSIFPLVQRMLLDM